MARVDVIAAELGTLAILHPSARLTSDQVNLMVEVYAEDFADVADDDFRAACKIVRGKCAFFPTPADFRKALAEHLERLPGPAPLALPDNPARYNRPEHLETLRRFNIRAERDRIAEFQREGRLLKERIADLKKPDQHEWLKAMHAPREDA